jgi:hypothetical protein
LFRRHAESLSHESGKTEGQRREPGEVALSQRDKIIQPGVARNELRRVIPNKIKNPERVLSTDDANDSTLSELMDLSDDYPA